MEKSTFLVVLILVTFTVCWSVEKCPEPCDCQHPQHILCSNRGLFSVPKSSHFVSPTATKTYSLGGNFIDNVSAEDFSNYYNLQRLDLQYNQIQFIHPKAFEQLTHLEELYLGNNGLSTLTTNAFLPLKKLKVLNVNSNQLHNVSHSSLANLVSLVKLRLDSNSIQILHGSPFLGLSNLLYLHLENNKIKNISKNAFVGLVKLRLLSLSGNPLNSLRHPIFLPLRSLSTLTIAGNNLQQLGPGVFNGLQRLSKLILSSNRISTLHSKALQGLGMLQELQLDGNSLAQLPVGLLTSLQSLEVLNLSRNALSTVHSGTFNGLNRLRVLDLQHNMLNFLPGDVFSGNPTLYRLQLDGNQWNCNCHLLGLKHWILGTLHSRSRMLTVFVQCREPQEVAGKYLDYLDDAYLQGVGGCTLSTIPPGLATTTHHQVLDLHQVNQRINDDTSIEPLYQTIKTISKLHLSAPKSTLSYGGFTLLQTLASVQKVSGTKGPLNTKRQSGTGRRKSLQTDKKTSIESRNPYGIKQNLMNLSQQHPETERQNLDSFQTATEPLTQLHLKQAEAQIPTSHKLPHSIPTAEPFYESTHEREQPTAEAEQSQVTSTLQSPSGMSQNDDLGPKLRQAILVSETLHQSHHDTLQPSFDSALNSHSETLHQVAPLGLSDPCEFNKLHLLNLSVESVGSNTARVRWQTSVSHTHGHVLFRVLYERFGQSGRFQRFVYPRGHAESLTLLELTGDTPYLVCVESIINGRACPVAPREHCVGLVTSPSEDERPILNYQMLALGLLALNALLLLLGLVVWISRKARKKWCRRRAPVHVRQMYSTRRPYRSVGTGVSTDFSGFQSHRPRTAVCALGDADLMEFPGCDRFREGGNLHRDDLLQRFTD
ncbi:TLR4 interactor with leucine rich repeats [Bufo gargarizans]|uniref:TLR4 interactor with leucine rich repeats n=1 Tax=Bufo gargarizans TaxID=30331 RepID=UPI001CF10A31|nr:TLR4 interactor with leucine rich repeats [Bufo gargarizans]